MEFWRNHLLGKPPILLLPTDKPRTANVSPLFKVPITLDSSIVNRLAVVARNALFTGDTGAAARKAELMWVVLAAFQVLLQRYSRQDDLTLGTPTTIHGNEVLPLRVDLEPNPTFAQLVAKNAALAKEIQQHGDISLAQLAEAVDDKKFNASQGNHPVFQIACIYEGSGEALRMAHSYNLDVLLVLRDSANGELEGELCGKETLFSSKTIQRMSRHFRVLLESIVLHAEEPLTTLEFVDADEREIVLNKFNNTARDLPHPYTHTTIHGLFEHWADVHPDARAISYESQFLTYKQLDEKANQLAAFLVNNGVTREQPVGVMLERSLEMMIAMLAVLKAGGAYVPMDPEYPEDRLALMAEDAEVPVLLSMSRIDAVIPLPPGAQRVNLDKDWAKIAEYPTQRPAQDRTTPDGLAYIIFTSGSTGRPKGTLLQHLGLINYLYYLVSEHELGADDVFLQKTPISFDVSVRELFFAFTVGAELVFAEPGGHRDTQYLAQLIASRGITCCSFVPSQLEIFLQEVDPTACQALRRVFVSGEALPPTSVTKFIELLPQAQLHNLYGPTEATVDVTGYDVRQHRGRATVPIGYPIANVKMYVLDAQLRPLPVGVPGELMISSRQLARGYIKRPDLTSEKFIDCPFGVGEYGKMYRTGDLARWLSEGVIEFLGRLDHQVKLRGFRIELGEIENGLCNCPGIRQAVAVIVKDKAGISHLVAYVTPDLIDQAEVIRELSQMVPEYMVPEVMVPMAALPSLPNGKINRRGLPEPDFSQTAQHDYVAPQNSIEEEIQDAWHEVFQMSPISVDVDFFKIGGNSLLAGRVISRLRQAFAVQLGIKALFNNRTIADLAVHIQPKLNQQASHPDSLNPELARKSLISDLSIPVYFGEKERVASTPCSYSQELLLFNNELDPFNPVHNEAAWVRVHGDLDIAAMSRAFRYLTDRHTVLQSHLYIAGVAGAMLKQTKPSKFRVPIKYVDLTTGEELPVPEVLERQNSAKLSSLPFKTIQRRQRLNTIKKANQNSLKRISSVISKQDSSMQHSPKAEKPVDTAHLMLPSQATRNLAKEIGALSTNNDDRKAIARLNTWLKTNEEKVEDSASVSAQPSSPAGSSYSGEEIVDNSRNGSGVRTTGDGAQGSLGIVDGQSGQSVRPLIGAETTYASPFETEMNRNSTGNGTFEDKEKKAGCFSNMFNNDQKDINPRASAMSGRTSAPTETDDMNETVKEVEAIASRVKKSLLLHYLTCGIYSTRQSGGSQGFWTTLKESCAACLGVEDDSHRRILPEVEDEGGIMIPELAGAKSKEAQRLRQMLLDDASEPFKIMQGPLLRVLIVRVKEDEHVILITMHHSVTDGWSTEIQWKELSAAYNAFHMGKTTVGLDPLPIQYADFANWQRKWLAQGAMSQQMDFWRKHLEGVRGQWDFPTDEFRPAVPTGNSKRVSVSLKTSTVQALKDLASQVNATMFMTLLAAWDVLLAKISGEDYIVCGLPYAGRSRAEVEGLIGAFLGAVALHADLKGNPSFRQVMQRVRKASMEVFEHADVPVHLVMADILGLKNLGGCAAPPLFQTMFFLHDSSWLEGLNLKGLKCDEPYKVEKNVARFDLTLEMTIDAAKNKVAGHIEYRTDLFKRSTVESLVGHFETLLESIIDNPDSSIWDLKYLPNSELRWLEGVRGVPASVLPQGAHPKTARPRVTSAKGELLPVGVPGRLTVQYNTGPSKDSFGGRHGSLIGLLSGGLGFKKMFDEQRTSRNFAEGKRSSRNFEETDRRGSVDDQETRGPQGVSIDMGSPRKSFQRMMSGKQSVTSLQTNESRPMSPFDVEPEPASPPAAAPLAENAPLNPNRRKSIKMEDLPPEKSLDTGLIARITSKGEVEILGELANRVPLGGVMTQLEDLDRQIALASPKVEKAATLLLKDTEGVERLVAYIQSQDIDLLELENTLRDRVPSNQIPSLFQKLHKLPSMASGEIDRSALPAPVWSAKLAKAYLPPQSRLEMEVQLIWKAVLNKKEMISCDADFSDIGGNMMHAVIANGIVREALGVQMPAINIFRDRTVVNVAERIKQIRRHGNKRAKKKTAQADVIGSPVA